ncbi:hypothetical protein AGABI1DRAFT_135263 [Agaricus bisporus var. burnettii JB137-S8]|uniref:Uncharacterized protein n=1 Tax=Agaricus bisporus var. burnettii (strain JB137-S8 / ATCC MYA-4627 / FGSC 10392) TaxID=597362 RepID=K5XFT5_AGABU|nr:uncharacterized protein AGABI1DRAFT_135263 [Agaricus bisporus var. burnettii JB137-S8]EKM73240.1 hypothetical protein AGABI1DRAFT_135263 [Agaricus bisporus var. burnettii JB137-S8]
MLLPSLSPSPSDTARSRIPPLQRLSTPAFFFPRIVPDFLSGSVQEGEKNVDEGFNVLEQPYEHDRG